MPKYIHYNDIGTAFTLKVVDGDTNAPIDCSAFTTLELIFDRPDTSNMVKTASLVTGTVSWLRYITVDGDLSQVGLWQVYPHVTTPTWERRGSACLFEVYRNP